VPLTSRTQPQQPATAASVQTRGTRSALLTAALVSTLGLGSTGQCSTEGSAERISAGGRRLRGQRVLQAQHASTRALLAGPPAQWRTPAIGTNGRATPHRPGPLRVVCRFGIRAQATRLPMWPHPPTHVAPPAYPCGPTRLRVWPSCRLAQVKQPPLPSTLPVDGPFSVARTHTCTPMHTRTHGRTDAHTHRHTQTHTQTHTHTHTRTHAQAGGGTHSLRKTVSSWSRTKLESL
jgi:hypothetical protein